MTKKTSENAKELPNGWEWKTVGEVTLNSKTKNPEKEPNQTFQYLDISSIDNINYKIIEIKVLLGSNAPSRARKVAMKYDTVFATTRPNLKNIAIIENDYENLICSTGFSILKAGKLINYKYLFLFFISDNIQKQIEPLIRGSQYPAISDKDVLSCLIPLPPLKEQERIVQKLDTAFQSLDEAITLQKENIAHTQELKKAVLVDTFHSLPYKIKTLDEVCSKITDGSHFSPKIVEEGYPYITVKDLDNGKIDFINCKKISELDYNNLLKSGCKPFKGDVLFSKDGTVGKVALVDIERDFVVLSSLGIFRPLPNKLNSQFLYWFLNSPLIQDHAEGLKTGAAIKRVVIKTLKTFQIPLPPLPEQERIVAYLETSLAKLDTLIVEQQERLAQLMELKKSILQEAFEGKL